MFKRQKSFDVYTISIKFYYQVSKRSGARFLKVRTNDLCSKNRACVKL